MRKTIVPILSCLFLGCSSDLEDFPIEEISVKTEKNLIENENSAPVIDVKSYIINEHSEVGVSIGFIAANDKDGDEITYAVASEEDFVIDENTGELKIGASLELDYETTQNIPFKISAFDGQHVTEEEFTLSIADINEASLLTDEQKELISYFQQLVFWKGDHSSGSDFSQKWGSTMKLHLSGTISDEFKTTVEEVIAEYNTLLADSDFSISLVDEAIDANADLFFGTKEEVEEVWPDMYDKVKNGMYSGYAITPSENSVLVSSRIWISNPMEVLLKHELGHALGFGHSNKCDDERSFLCSKISSKNDFLPIEEEVIRLHYDSQIPAGLTETEIQEILANLIFNEN